MPRVTTVRQRSGEIRIRALLGEHPEADPTRETTLSESDTEETQLPELPVYPIITGDGDSDTTSHREGNSIQPQHSQTTAPLPTPTPITSIPTAAGTCPSCLNLQLSYSSEHHRDMVTARPTKEDTPASYPAVDLQLSCTPTDDSHDAT